jgi:hypothetical protein
VPSSASRERFGVLMVESPKAGILLLKSSATSQTIFRGLFSASTLDSSFLAPLVQQLKNTIRIAR